VWANKIAFHWIAAKPTTLGSSCRTFKESIQNVPPQTRLLFVGDAEAEHFAKIHVEGNRNSYAGARNLDETGQPR
jgi:hypothetical protein